MSVGVVSGGKTTITPTQFNFESVKVCDIAPELKSLGTVSMMDKTVRIEL